MLSNKLNEASETFDVLITSGGASAGDEDHLASLLNNEGQVTEWRIAIKPGRPMAMGFWHEYSNLWACLEIRLLLPPVL